MHLPVEFAKAADERLDQSNSGRSHLEDFGPQQDTMEREKNSEQVGFKVCDVCFVLEGDVRIR